MQTPKPLFRPEALRSHLTRFALPPHAADGRSTFSKWSNLFATKSGAKMKETELRDEFLYDVFRDLLGYPTAKQNPVAYTFKKEQFVEVDGTYADAAFGQFGGATERTVAVLEGKGPGDPLDRPYKSRKRSAFEQSLLYAYNQRCDWFLVTNLRETRLYCKGGGGDQLTFERFETDKLATDEEEYRRFVFLLGAERVVPTDGPCHLNGLLAESAKLGRELTRQFYGEYRALREHTFDALRTNNPKADPAVLLATTQKVLDRVLFIAFCEDRDLLPRNIVARAYTDRNQFSPQPVWDNFKGLFKAVNGGNKALGIWKYNGGLFADDPVIDGLIVPDSVCEGFKKLADYEYGRPTTADATLIDVDILGHVFEQSISDLEDMQNVLAGRVKVAKAKEQKRNTRKEAGAFYTPAFITRFIVRETLRPVLDARFERLRAGREQTATKTVRKLFADPAAFDAAALTNSQKTALEAFWESWIAELETVRVVDPACGSGAFLIEAFDQLFAEYERAQSYLTQLRGRSLFDIRKAILEHNLYGVDLNGEAVEIARLSCWIKTAEHGKTLTSLDHNIVVGNSVVTDPAVHTRALDWRAAFPEVFATGGFDAVIGNPPYVRHEWIKEFKPHWAATFATFDNSADLFVYFYELGLSLLRPGGRLGFITSGGWVRGGYGEGLRDYLAKNAGLEAMIDFGEFQPFEDAEMIRPTILIASKRDPGGRMKLWKWLEAGRPPEDLSVRIAAAPLMSTEHLGREAWELESDEVIALRAKMRTGGDRLLSYTQGGLCYGIKTGANDVFVIDAAKREELVAAHPSSDQLIKPFIQGTNLREWHIDPSDEYLIFTRRGVRIEDYPAVLDYLTQHRAALEPKPDGWDEDNPGQVWPGRKPGSYQWYEIQDSVDYWPAFERTKIVWPDITNRPRFSMDLENRYLGNTGYVIPGGDYYLLAVLSSWASWFYISKTAQPLRLRSNRWQYRLIAQFMENIPIPDAPAAERKALGTLAERCNELGTGRYRIEEQVRGRLTTAFRTDPATKLNEKSQEWWLLPLTELGKELKTSFKLNRNPLTNPTTADEWEPYLTGKRKDVDALRHQLAAAEEEINDRVFRLFDLTPDEIKLLLKEVEH